MPRTAAPIGTLAGVGAAFVYVASFDPNQPGHYPACPLLAVTGIYCPGCGGLRSAYAVAHGDLASALHANVLAVVLFVAFAALWTHWFLRRARGLPYVLPLRPRLMAWHGWAAGALVVAFTVVRNTPLGTALIP
ncbi:DUF2752 domain-containing protein [Streptomyces iconiensis]|uniref:DUF2752 domain-containing protein n=1 Tax=Streptomyces iconiensis TaxID=1384038 RepID=A0ABT7A1T1_9ACTN|nr:DUF2752 domain-containing protein [Streptomyces iconiensis]MDJ1135280.1 DUF2752 domain-containing protein [Streptomyces iconiensis]